MYKYVFEVICYMLYFFLKSEKVKKINILPCGNQHCRNKHGQNLTYTEP